jgi:hypothetical protein
MAHPVPKKIEKALRRSMGLAGGCFLGLVGVASAVGAEAGLVDASFSGLALGVLGCVIGNMAGMMATAWLVEVIRTRAQRAAQAAGARWLHAAMADMGMDSRDREQSRSATSALQRMVQEWSMGIDARRGNPLNLSMLRDLEFQAAFAMSDKPVDESVEIEVGTGRFSCWLESQWARRGWTQHPETLLDKVNPALLEKAWRREQPSAAARDEALEIQKALNPMAAQAAKKPGRRL